MIVSHWLSSLASQVFRHQGGRVRSPVRILGPQVALVEKLEDRALLAAAFSEFIDPHPAVGNQFGSTVVALSTGNVVITSPFDDAGGTDAGAVYLFNGATGALISTLIGSTPGDHVGEEGVTALGNGNYLVNSPNWHNGAAANAGAVTFGSGTTGISGVVSAANSLVGSTSGDRVGVGYDVTVLSNSNYLISSANWDNGTAVDAGAVTFGSGTTGISGAISAINSLVGGKTNDFIGSSGITVLSIGNYLVNSPSWDNGAAANAGAVTFGSGTTGISGVVSAANSLVGSTSNDGIGGYSGSYIYELSNGNYLVVSQSWDNGSAIDAGAVTFGSGTTGVSGVVSAANSLVGSKSGDKVSYWGISQLGNSNYLVSSPLWDNGAATDAGAVTFGSGTTGVSGVISQANSLVGSTSGDSVGYEVKVLSNDNYVVSSSSWDNGSVANVGAVTFGSGTAGVSGVISATNSLVGSTSGDRVGSDGITTLSNGNYVVSSYYWDNSSTTDVGAVTFGNGTTGVSGVVSATNSLVGSRSSDMGYSSYYGKGSVKALNNGNYLVINPNWDNETVTDAGAVTFGNGTTGISGVVSAANSLVGSSVSDRIGYGGIGITVLSNGNYVVSSGGWDNGAAIDSGAATFGSGTTGVSGVISAINSLVGTTSGDGVGQVTALSNGNYLVTSSSWNNGDVTRAGAVTFGSGTTGVSGVVSATNSLIGTTSNDFVGQYGYGITELTNGNYLVESDKWDNGSAIDAGAVTFGSGITGVSGVVSAANSLVGSTSGDRVGHSSRDGSDHIKLLSNGNYVVQSSDWDNGAAVDAGAVTFGSGTTGISGVVSAANSLVGSTSGDSVGAQFNMSITALSNGNYLVSSTSWDNGSATDAGALTFGSGTTGVSGVVSAANSLVGATSFDGIGDFSRVIVLSNGNYLVSSRYWDNGSATNAGALTFGSGTAGVSGVVSAANSLVGSTSLDYVGSLDNGSVSGIKVLSNGNYVVASPNWDNGAVTNSGAVTFGSGLTGVSGVISRTNSAIGLTSNTNLQSVVVDDINSTFFSRFLDAGGGKIRIGSQVVGFVGIGNSAPEFTSSASPSVPENARAVPLSADDYDLDAITFSIAGGTDRTKFEIVNGVLQFKVAPDFENPSDSNADNTYEVLVQADDGHQGVVKATIQVTVTNVEETDYGDAPDTGAGTGTGNYQTLSTDNGPSHINTTTQTMLFLGARVDGETEASPFKAQNAAFTQSATDLPQAISDNTTTTSHIAVSGKNRAIGDVNVTLDLVHTYDGDLVITLISPSGTHVVLSNRTGGSGDDFNGTTFDDESTVSLTTGTAPFHGTYRPENSLSVLDNEIINGDWQLQISDTGGGDVGVLNSWSLTFTRLSAPGDGLDEDGLVEPAQDLVLTVGTAPDVRVRATNTTGLAATLYGWIDYNRDGVFGNATERTSVLVPSGTNNGTFTLIFPTIPIGTSAGATYARFRLSSDVAAANPTGAAIGGEVEDYAASITQTSKGTTNSAKNVKIASDISGGPTLADGDSFGRSAVSLGDLDGDGVTDLAVGASGDSAGGAVSVQFMNTDGTVKSRVKLSNGINGSPTSLADFGRSLASLGDLDGDGVTDLAVGADRSAYVLFLNANGTVKSSVKLASGMNGDPTLGGSNAFGSSLASLGDLDGDGVTDLAVGDYYDQTHGQFRGAVYVLYLNSNGSVKSSVKIADNTNGGPTLTNHDYSAVP